MNARISQLWQRFRAPTKEFKRSHIEEMFTIIREQQAQIEQLEAPVKEVMAQSEDFDGVNTIAYIRAMHKKMDGQRKHIAALETKLRAVSGHGNATTDADRQVSARTAGEAPASDGDPACPAVPASHDLDPEDVARIARCRADGTAERACDEIIAHLDKRAGASPALRAYQEAMQAAGVPHEPLQVYDSNSWKRVGLAREYREVMYPIVMRDGHPNICGTDTLVALVAAFNAMLERSAAELCPACERLKQLLATTLDGEQGIHVSTGGKSRDEKLFSARDVQAFTAIGFALRKKHEAERAAKSAKVVTGEQIDALLRALSIESALPELTAMNHEAVRTWLAGNGVSA